MRYVIVLCAVLPIAESEASAQQLSVFVRAAESQTPLPGAHVILSDSAGDIQRRVTDLRGRATFADVPAGDLAVRAEVLGREARRQRVTLSDAGSQALTLTFDLDRAPFVLTELRVDAERRCQARDENATELLQVWSEIQTFLRMQNWVDKSGEYEFSTIRRVREFDETGRRLRRELQSDSMRTSAIPFAAVSGDSLSGTGFVRTSVDGGLVYFAPDAEYLLSDLFLNGHCLRIVRDPSRRGMVGLSFRPMPRPDDVSGIEGNLWVDETTHAINSIEFHYVRHPIREADRLAHGRIEYATLPTGEFVIRSWHIRAPVMTRVPGLVRPTDAGVRVASYQETRGDVISVSYNGVSVVLGSRGAVRGKVVARTSGSPIAGAEVLLEGTNYMTVSNAEGNFVIPSIPVGRYSLVVNRILSDTVRTDAASVTIVSGDTAEVSISVASPVRRTSPAPPERQEQLHNRSGTQGIRATVLDQESQRPVSHAIIRVAPRTGGNAYTAETDSRGRFAIELQNSGEYFLSIESLGYRAVERHEVLIPLGRIVVLTILVAPDALRLDPVFVETDVRSYHLDREGFYRRKQEGLGFFITPEVLERRRPHRVTNLLFGVPGVRVIEPIGGGRGRAIKFASTLDCWPMVYIDRHLVSTGGSMSAGAEPTAIDEIVFAADILAVEVYRTPAEIPSEFNGPNAGCGVVVLWTHRGGR